ncbi:amino acid ABC transporter permease [Bosea sp. (in: a-proteobacteria)]|uniref:amino acid ABC transporter permease n=1 Tax=Bosea sp. (in: a-proteobacteria) TaxID=1871050 RepID=UPI0027364C5C|nr:ABC transporter permease subunit [Bosea sp. (in: a-proteobacteria)]MDP3407587.1 ABC transporter permease subunit [Bosea sp. (in: a-proteobacteria)]
MALLDSPAPPGAGARLIALFNNATVRSVVYQAVTLAAVVLLFWYLVSNTIENMSQRDMSAGFDFLGVSAGFGIGFTLIPYREGDTYLRVFMVGIANTMLVAVVAIVLSTILGLFVGLARLSNNWVIRNVARWYIEVLRNTPLLLQIIAWYFGVFTLLPRPRDSAGWLDAFFLNNRGLYMPAPVIADGFGVVLAALGLGLVGAVVWARFVRRERENTGRIRPVLLPVLALLIGPPLLATLVAGAPVSWDMPQLRGFNFVGGINIPPSFCALIIALSIYTSCFIGENVRSGIQSVSHGQTEAARALGVPPGRTMRSIILPQALRVIIPPLISQYLNVTKNSSLAIAIGFPDLVSVFMNTSLNQSGRAIPIVAMTMGFYCLVSLAVSLAMNRYNRSILIRER